MMVACAHAEKRRIGRDRNGNQRFRCLNCGKTWTVREARPLGDMRVSVETARCFLPDVASRYVADSARERRPRLEA